MEAELEITNYYKSLILQHGREYIEIHFYKYYNSFIKNNKNTFNEAEIYKLIFPDNVLTYYGIKNLFLKISNSWKVNINPYSLKSHELIYNTWIINSFNSKLYTVDNTSLRINENSVILLYEKFREWKPDYKEIKGGDLRTHIKVFLLQKNISISTIKNKFPTIVSQDIEKLKEQLNENEIRIYYINDQVMFFTKENGDIFYYSKPYLKMTNTELREWLTYFGINVSSVTIEFIKEFGLPYNGQLINYNSCFNETDNGPCVFGLLFYELKQYYNKLNHNQLEELKIEIEKTPLIQSVILALARLENYLNPHIFI